VLLLTNISKSFAGVKALDNVGLELHRGEVLALVGENGAGKSTLIRIISGAYQQDEGEMYYNGQNMGKMVPQRSLELGISVIYQELSYLPAMTVAENIYLGKQPKKFGLINYKELVKNSKGILDMVGLSHVDPETRVVNLSTAEKQLLEIARAYARNISILVLDEPTSALNDVETQKLFSLIKSLQAQGKSIIYISHKLDEIFEIADHVQILRDGKSIIYSPIDKIDKNEIIRHMVGREISEMYPIKERPIGEYILEVDDLTGDYLKGVSVKVRSGEIVGLYGLMGAGCPEVLESIFGYKKHGSRTVKVKGKQWEIKTPMDAITSGIAYVPSERKTEGIITVLSVIFNITLVTLKKYRRWFVLNLKKEIEVAEAWVGKLKVKTPSIRTLTNNLSGGNQQKVILAKWLDNNPEVFLLNEPTKGIDVGSKVEIYKEMEYLCNAGCGILLFTAELPELLSICDRVYVMFEGGISGEIEKAEMTQDTVVRKAIGL